MSFFRGKIDLDLPTLGKQAERKEKKTSHLSRISRVLIPATIASGLPERVPAWYMGPAGATYFFIIILNKEKREREGNDERKKGSKRGGGGNLAKKSLVSLSLSPSRCPFRTISMISLLPP